MDNRTAELYASADILVDVSWNKGQDGIYAVKDMVHEQLTRYFTTLDDKATLAAINSTLEKKNAELSGEVIWLEAKNQLLVERIRALESQLGKL
jgi:hypothetical protein